MSRSRILIRATNWIGDAVMSLPAIRAIRATYPRAHIAVMALPWVADLYARETAINRVIPYSSKRGLQDIPAKLRIAQSLRAEGFDCAILLQNAFEAAAITRLAGIPERIGYDRDARGWLLTNAVPVPKLGEIPHHELFYYLELLRRASIIPADPNSNWFSEENAIRLEGRDVAAQQGSVHFASRGMSLPVIGLSPGAAYGRAKRWLPERFAESTVTLARENQASVAIFGSAQEQDLCETVRRAVAAAQIPVSNLAGATTLREFIEMAAACQVYLSNDSGAMHIASALGVPSVTIFGATDDTRTGPTGPLARVVREQVDCSPCLKRECPIDHRCMTRVPSERVVDAARELLQIAHAASAPR